MYWKILLTLFGFINKYMSLCINMYILIEYVGRTYIGPINM